MCGLQSAGAFSHLNSNILLLIVRRSFTGNTQNFSKTPKGAPKKLETNPLLL